jgi:hypothetical protein
MIHLLACYAILVVKDVTPEATVRAAIDALGRQSWKELFSRVDGAKVAEASAAIEKLSPKPDKTPTLEIKDLKLTITGDTATGSLSIVFPSASGQTMAPQSSEVTLKNIGGDWKIEGGKGFFDEIVKFGKDPIVVQAQAHAAAEKTIILSNVRQIALGVLMFSGDNDDKIKLTQANIKAKLKPYLRNDALWIGPDKKPLDIRINPNLIGKSMTSVAAPAETVMLSWGPKSALVYSGGRTIIGFTDGHVKWVSKEAVAKLKW